MDATRGQSIDDDVALYFSVMTVSTIGYGDVGAQTDERD